MTNSLPGSLLIPTRRRIFVSYHHDNDQRYYNEFSRLYSETYDVLCGAETPQRKYVDWEIKATLDKYHGLVGVNLPTSLNYGNGVVVPERFGDNYHSGYAVWLQWQGLTTRALIDAIEAANSRSTSLINNSRPMRLRNG